VTLSLSVYLCLSVCVCVQVKVLWVFNVQQTNWEKALPEDTRAMLDRSRSKRGGLYAKEGATEAEADGERTQWFVVLGLPCVAQHAGQRVRLAHNAGVQLRTTHSRLPNNDDVGCCQRITSQRILHARTETPVMCTALLTGPALVPI
jgi:hypothetical protein